MDAARARSVRDDGGDRTAFGGRPGTAVRIGGARAHRRLRSAAAPAAIYRRHHWLLSPTHLTA
ncbi:hypothetical protein, partial [Frankia gtarii]|uniref:hypothetical protein n=1 Tax=Frankia gtarii TaxID=2950102 RepID=UPI0021C1B57A